MEFSADHPLRTWQDRVASYPAPRNVLWDIVGAYRELGLIGDAAGRPKDPRTGLPGFSEAEMNEIVGHLGDKSALRRMWQERNPAITDYQHYAHDTGYEGSRAVQNIRHYAPVSLLVCPTRRYINFEHFVGEASPQEIGGFFKSVLHSAREEVLAHDAAVAANPPLADMRRQYEDQFAQMRQWVEGGNRLEDFPGARAITQMYIEDSARFGFACRDPRTGHSGFRVFMNNSPEVAGMSQPHFHVQVAGGRFLGHAYSQDPAQEYSPKEIDAAARSIAL
ncbi:MAG: hypothetical protein WDN72_06950 [Alphaproteobacteria bacterium]